MSAKDDSHCLVEAGEHSGGTGQAHGQSCVLMDLSVQDEPEELPGLLVDIDVVESVPEINGGSPESRSQEFLTFCTVSILNFSFWTKQFMGRRLMIGLLQQSYFETQNIFE